MGSVWRDLSYGLRVLLSSRGFTILAATSLAIAISVNTTLFTVADAFFLRLAPVSDPSTLAALYTVDSKNSGYHPVSYLNFHDIERANTTLESMSLFASADANYAPQNGPSERINIQLAGGNYFALLKVPMLLGSAFEYRESPQADKHAVAVLSYYFWKTRLNGDKNIVGKSVRLNNRLYEVTGVAERGFRGLSALSGPELWVPVSMQAYFMREPQFMFSRRAIEFYPFGRLKPGLTPQQAQMDLARVATELEETFPVINAGRKIVVFPIQDAGLHPNTRQDFEKACTLVGGAGLLLLLIAVANVASLLMARVSRRSKEMAVRQSLGAGPRHLARQLFAESMMIAASGGLLGWVLSFWLVDLVWQFRPQYLHEGNFTLELNWHAALFAAALSMMAGILFWLAPAIEIMRRNLSSALKERSSTADAGARTWNLRHALVTGQVALSLVAIIGALLFLKSLDNQRHHDPGFDTANIGFISMNLPDEFFPFKGVLEYSDRVLEVARKTPGVERASISSSPVYREPSYLRTLLVAEENDRIKNTGTFVISTAIGTQYFETMGIGVKTGRTFKQEDRADSEQVAIVNEQLARTMWPGQSPIGRKIARFGDNSLAVIVGVVGNTIHTLQSEAPQSCVYYPMTQDAARHLTLAVRTKSSVSQIVSSVAARVGAVDKLIPLVNEGTSGELMEQSLWGPRMNAGLLSLLSLLALLLSGIGVYGVINYSIERRRSEIGIRIALGARTIDVMRMVFGESARLLFPGLVAGSITAILGARWAEHMLFEVAPNDPATIFESVAVLTLVALAACYVPARRAAKVDPAITLRQE